MEEMKEVGGGKCDVRKGSSRDMVEIRVSGGRSGDGR